MERSGKGNKTKRFHFVAVFPVLDVVCWPWEKWNIVWTKQIVCNRNRFIIFKGTENRKFEINIEMYFQRVQKVLLRLFILFFSSLSLSLFLISFSWLRWFMYRGWIGSWLHGGFGAKLYGSQNKSSVCSLKFPND